MITQVAYARTYNLGNYENERIEAVATVENGDAAAAYVEAKAAVETQHARPAPVVTPPASMKQRNYIAALQDELGWTSEQLVVYASEQHIDLVEMTVSQASEFISGLRKLTSGDIPF